MTGIDYMRTAAGIERHRQLKYERWAIEMKEHGWECRPPGPKLLAKVAEEQAMKRKARRERERELEEAEVAR